MDLKVILLASVLCVASLSNTCQAESETEQLPSAEADSPPGHMQPLGSHMEPKPVTRINYMPTPQEFNRKFVSPKQPVIFEGLMSNQEVIKNWQSDEYLRTKFGDDEFGVEQRKKENRSLDGFTMTMAKFLDVYNEKDIYMIGDLSLGMYNEWVVPRFLQCGGYADHTEMVLLWFSSGGTKSVLHSDTQENLHCLVSGMKMFVIIKPYFAKSIGPEHKDQGFYNLDVERVNMTAYPNLTRIPWYLASLNPGDCLYLPYNWLHNVESTGRNMAINIWWNLFNFNPEDCPSDANELPEFFPLSDFEPEIAFILRKQLEEAKKEDGKVYASDILNDELKRAGMELEHIEELFEALQPGSKGVLTDIDKIPREALRKGGLFLMDMFSSHMHPEGDLEQPEEEKNGEGEEAGESEPEWLHSQQERDEL